MANEVHEFYEQMEPLQSEKITKSDSPKRQSILSRVNNAVKAVLFYGSMISAPIITTSCVDADTELNKANLDENSIVSKIENSESNLDSRLVVTGYDFNDGFRANLLPFEDSNIHVYSVKFFYGKTELESISIATEKPLINIGENLMPENFKSVTIIEHLADEELKSPSLERPSDQETSAVFASM